MFKLFYLSVDTLRRRTNPTNNEHTAIRECSHLLKLIGPDLNQCWSLFVSFTEPLTIYCQPNTQNHWSRTTTRIASTEKNLHLLWWQPTPNHPCLYKLHLTSTFRTYSKKIAILSRIWTYSSISNARGRLSSFRWQKIISKWVKWGKGRGFSLLPSPAENLIVRTRVFWKFYEETLWRSDEGPNIKLLYLILPWFTEYFHLTANGIYPGISNARGEPSS